MTRALAPSSLSSRKSASAFGTDRPVARLDSRRDDDDIDELARRRSVSPYRRFEAAPASPVACLLRCVTSDSMLPLCGRCLPIRRVRIYPRTVDGTLARYKMRDARAGGPCYRALSMGIGIGSKV